MVRIIHQSLIAVVLLIVVPQLSFGQYFSRFYDDDSVFNWGWDIFLKPDSNYLLFGWSYNQSSGRVWLNNIELDQATNNIITRHRLQEDTTFRGIGTGNPGETKRLLNGEYIMPITVQWHNHATGYLYSAAGLGKYSAVGDTICVKTYTDTSVHFDNLYCSAIVPTGGFLFGGDHALNTPSYAPGFVVRTDTAGDTLWTRSYQKYSGQSTIVYNLIPLNDGRIVVAAASITNKNAGPPLHLSYSYYTPWFLVLDNSGNILRDTFFSSGFIARGDCSLLYRDNNGGYISIGMYDSLYTPYPNDIENFPGYIAHLDSNFRVTWTHFFTYSDVLGRRQAVIMKQLDDSSYLFVGDAQSHHAPGNWGFAAKLDKSGHLVWEHTYCSDTINFSYLRGALQKPDGNLLLVGKSYNDSLPSWHSSGDAWLLGVDSNGCEIPGCITLATPSVQNSNNERMTVWPNPTNGTFTFKVSSVVDEAVRVVVANIAGERLIEIVGTTNRDIRMNLNTPPGIYFVNAVARSGTWSKRIILDER